MNECGVVVITLILIITIRRSTLQKSTTNDNNPPNKTYIHPAGSKRQAGDATLKGPTASIFGCDTDSHRVNTDTDEAHILVIHRSDCASQSGATVS